MKYWKIIMLLLFCYNNQSTCIIQKKTTIQDIRKTIQQKTRGFIKIIRPNNIVPTLFLSFTGGWIANPSLQNLLSSPKFIVSAINTVNVMSSSMVVNDIFDMEVDTINNPKRPLVTGEITKKDAILFNCFIIGLTEFLSFRYLTPKLTLFVNLALLNVTLYTPILKKILFVKNLSCASLVAFSLYFAGLASINTNSFLLSNQSKKLLSIASNIIFFGSLYNELVLDMRDYEGDKKMGINTVPVVYGLNKTLDITYKMTKYSIVFNSIWLMSLFDYYSGVLFMIILTPLLHYLKAIHISNYSKESIRKASGATNIPLFMFLFYSCVLAKMIKK